MILSRRSFLKMAGLTVVAAASASMFTGCGAFSTTPIWKSPLSPLNNFSKVLFERRAFARLFLFCPLSSKKVPAAVHPVLRRTAAVIYNKEQCKHHPVFCRKDIPSCEFVFIPLAARST